LYKNDLTVIPDFPVWDMAGSRDKIKDHTSVGIT